MGGYPRSLHHIDDADPCLLCTVDVWVLRAPTRPGLGTPTASSPGSSTDLYVYSHGEQIAIGAIVSLAKAETLAKKIVSAVSRPAQTRPLAGLGSAGAIWRKVFLSV